MKTIALASGRGVALVDDDQFDRLTKFSWYLRPDSGNRYAQTTLYCRVDNVPRKFTSSMHRFVVDCPRGFEVDHINGDGLDNRASNLRLCSHGQNLANMRRNRGGSRYRGVSWHGASGKWRAQLSVDGRRMSLGVYDCEADAAIAYNAAALNRYGEFANLNKIAEE